jgi:membrane protein
MGNSVATTTVRTERPRANTITQIVTKIGPSSAASTFAGPIKSITSHKSAAGIVGLIGLGLGVALSSASSYVGAFMRASNVIYETPDGRPIWKLRPLQVLVTLVMLVLLVLVAPNVKLAGFRWVTPGAVFAVVIWLIARPRSRSTWPISAAMTRPTAPSGAWSYFSCGCG